VYGATVGSPEPVSPEPVLPAYGSACIDRVAAALLARPAERPGWFPGPAREASQIVLLVLDGLGWTQLRDRQPLAPNLSGLPGGAITSVVPTTTATALTSISLSAAPAAHGVVGYRLRVDGPSGSEVLNVLRWRTSSGDARPFVPPAAFQPAPAFGGRTVPVVTRSEFLTSGFSAAHLSGSRQIGWSLPSTLVVEVRRLLSAGEPFVYAYYDGLDKVAHIHGLGEYYDAELTAADRLVGDLIAVLPPGAALVVTADHGQVDVGGAVRQLDPEIVAATELISGEGRFRWLHARPGAAGDVAVAAKERYGDEAWVRTIDQLDAEGWFGGRLDHVARRRLGDVALVPHQPVAYLDPLDQGDARLVSRHGSLTADEMYVPLLAAGRC
jgi:hypothetical protein